MTENLIHATVSQWGVVFDAGDVLVVRRTSDGAWELPGGRIAVGEDARSALVRELVEETSLQPTVITPVHTFTWRNETGQDRFAVCYYCEAHTNTVSLSGEHTSYKWVRPSDAREWLDEPQSTAINKAETARQQDDQPLDKPAQFRPEFAVDSDRA